MGQRDERRRRILALVSSRNLATQEELARALTEAGWKVTQSSVSRDIAALGLVKAAGCYRPAPRGIEPAADPDERTLHEGIIDVKPAGDALLVLRTRLDEAGRVATSLDRLGWPGMVGTVAGLDTVFAACTDRNARDRLLLRLRAFVRAARKA
jgi:transcriptional regulator of arginine metabolism